MAGTRTPLDIPGGVGVCTSVTLPVLTGPGPMRESVYGIDPATPHRGYDLA